MAIVERARKQLRLNRVIVIPAFIAPHKQQRSTARPSDRLEMTRLALQKKNRCSVSVIEIRRRGVSYTVDTLKKFRKRHRKGTLFLIVGSDNLGQLHTWKSYKDILTMATLAVYGRSGTSATRPRHIPPTRLRVLRGPRINVSSSGIRRIARRGGSISALVPEHVERYIRSRHLYGT